MGQSRNRFLLFAASLGPALSACGGGGGGAGSGVADHRINHSASYYETAEYKENYGLRAIGASSIYSEGGTGRGFKVAVIDTGLDVDHPEFAGAIDGSSTNIVTGNAAHLDDEHGHGTMVSGVVGARRNDALAHGVAFESRILAIRADTPGSCATSCSFSQSNLAAATDYAVSHGSAVINYSLGGASSLSTSFRDALRDAAADGKVLVFAAGNEEQSEPTYPAKFAGSTDADGHAIAVGAVDENNEIVVSGTWGWGSNKAGSVRDFFLVAPGVNVVTTAKDGGKTTGNGTSFAAPHVSGAAAAVWDAASHLTGKQVVDLLLTTATDLGDPGVDAIYGHGLLNLKEALSPQGARVVPTGDSVTGSGSELATTGLRLGAAFGDALAGASLLSEAIFLDGYARAYRVDLAPAVAPRSAGVDLTEWLSRGSGQGTTAVALTPRIAARFDYAERAQAFAERGGTTEAALNGFAVTMTPTPGTEVSASRGYGLAHRFGLAGKEEISNLLSAGALASPYLALAGDGDSVILGGEGGGGLSFRLGLTRDATANDPAAADVENRRAAYVAEMRREWVAGGHLSVRVGQLVEREGVLNTVGRGAFALDDRAETLFVGMTGGVPLMEGVELFGTYTVGQTRNLAPANGLLRDFSSIRSDAVGGGLAIRGVLDPADRLVLSVSRPLKVTSGSATLDIPVGRTPDGAVVRRAERIELAPSGDQIDAELSYRIRFGRGQDLQVNGMLQFEPGHAEDADAAVAAAARYRVAF